MGKGDMLIASFCACGLLPPSLQTLGLRNARVINAHLTAPRMPHQLHTAKLCSLLHPLIMLLHPRCTLTCYPQAYKP